MKIVAIEATEEHFGLVRPYKIANMTFDSVANCIVKLTLENGIVGLGAAAPADFVTGETIESTLKALSSPNLSWLLSQSIYCLPAHANYLQTHFSKSPASAAAIDIALHDAYSKLCQLPLVDILGRVHSSLPTSITIGIKGIDESIVEAAEYVGRGFKHLKIKLGEVVEEDIELVHRLRESLPDNIMLRVDMNQGYNLDDFRRFILKTEKLGIELIEQPFAKNNRHALQQLPQIVRERIAADEDLLTADDGFKLVTPERLCGIFNIKLMKCGGISSALQIAALANYADIDLMWGCMDESRISIAAALHAAFACRKTKYLDLDGSFDLAEDIVQGGFILENGCLRTTGKAGLGVDLR